MNSLELKYGRRNSNMVLEEVYFWTDTIKDWNQLLDTDDYKQIIIKCWHELVLRKKVKIYGFVIMPNHLHVIWEMLEHNGKEMLHASFNKFTSHEFLRTLRIENSQQLIQYQENDLERNHRFWQRDPLAVLLGAKEKMEFSSKTRVLSVVFHSILRKWT